MSHVLLLWHVLLPRTTAMARTTATYYCYATHILFSLGPTVSQQLGKSVVHDQSTHATIIIYNRVYLSPQMICVNLNWFPRLTIVRANLPALVSTKRSVWSFLSRYITSTSNWVGTCHQVLDWEAVIRYRVELAEQVWGVWGGCLEGPLCIHCPSSDLLCHPTACL